MATENTQSVSKARLERRASILEAANALVGFSVGPEFDPVHNTLEAIDVVMVAGSPWLSDGLQRDYYKDESGYKKIGGASNSPDAAYFFRSTANLIHYLKRQGFYIPRGVSPPQVGMVCFFDVGDRGRFNFAPDRSGIITNTRGEQVTKVIKATEKKDRGRRKSFTVLEIDINPSDELDVSLIGYSDFP